jgi:LysR family transcriptional regulator, transcriptional activator of nhaA
MDWLNYHHLFYFWTVVREGGVSKASKVLRLAQPTVSGQIKALENALDQKLFERQGRSLVLTDVGQVVFRYADEIFNLGRELQDTLRGRPVSRPRRLVVGVSDSVEKRVAHRLLVPALESGEPVQLVVQEARPERLVAELAAHSLDLVLSDTPAPSPVRAYSHLLGECGVGLFARPALARKLAPGFPRSMDGAPLLTAADGAVLQRSLAHWFETRGIRPQVVGEFQDSALMESFGEAGVGVFPAPEAVESEVRSAFGVERVGSLEGVRERYWALTVERKLKHPAVVAITETARSELFGSAADRGRQVDLT